MTISIKTLNAQEFLDIEDEWLKLLLNSDANPLFLSWAWQYNWWITWSEKLQLELILIVVYDYEELIGIAPLFRAKMAIGPIKTFKRIQFIGNTWRLPSTVRTEYLSFIVQSSRALEVNGMILDFIYQKISWHEWILNDVDSSSLFLKNVCTFEKVSRLLHRSLNVERGITLKCNESFELYLSSLSRNTRARAYNGRKKLLAQGKVKLAKINQFEKLDFAFEQLNRLHKVRWGSVCFNVDALAFHKKLCKKLLNYNSNTLDFSLIYLNNEVISVLYNIIVDGVKLNIQAGYNDKKFKGISLGSLHLGYAIEDAFNCQYCDKFDFLAGFGMNSDYKKKYKGDTQVFKTIQLIKSTNLKYLYKIYDIVPSRFKQWLYHKEGFG
jgi:hypothetical protein